MDNLIKSELFKNLDSFTNEISLTMDYISSELITKIEKYITKLKKDDLEFNDFTNITYKNLGEFEVNFSGALFSNKKVKTSYFDFLNRISLFPKDSCLEFNIFKDEAKATKKAFVSYLYNIYLSCLFLVKFQNDKSEDLSKDLKDFVDKIKKEAETAVNSEYEKVAKPVKNVLTDNVLQDKMPGLDTIMEGMGAMGGMGGMSGIMSSILGNKEIMNIASDISSQMQNQKLDPMSMLSSLMSGNIENGPLGGLVTQIQKKVEMKISSGEIDKNVLESQAQSIMSNINPESLNSLPGMAEMMRNMASKMPDVD